MPSANCPLPFCPLPIALCHLPSANCPLPFSLCQLPSVKYPLPFALCRLPSVKCPLPITPFSGGHLEEGKWQRANGRGQMAEGIWHRGHLEEGFWKRVFGWGQFLGRAVRFGGHLEKSFWKRAFGRGQISGGQLACTPEITSLYYSWWFSEVVNDSSLYVHIILVNTISWASYLTLGDMIYVFVR